MMASNYSRGRSSNLRQASRYGWERPPGADQRPRLSRAIASSAGLERIFRDGGLQRETARIQTLAAGGSHGFIVERQPLMID